MRAVKELGLGLVGLGLIAISATPGCTKKEASSDSPFVALPEKAPEPSDNPTTEAKVKLGRVLYFDSRISADGTISCNTCHDVTADHGADAMATSTGIKGQKGGRNSPTVWNSAFHSVQFWDGRAMSLEEQALGPITNIIEMGAQTHAQVEERISGIKGYAPLFDAAFGDSKVTKERMAKAIAAYERTLITPDGPYDRYLKGDKNAMTEAAVRGMKTFEATGCVSCHYGRNLNGPSLAEGKGFYQKFPTIPGTEYDKKYGFTQDEGRFEVTKNEADKHMFRVPTLRNIARTAPYFHNGKVTSLDEAVRVMAKTQLNKDLASNEVQDIVAFLTALNGKLPKEQAPPALPQ
jgi:cytochrome c peroxidase